MAENPDPVTQMNVRVPRSLITAIDSARAKSGLSRDKFVAEACRLGLAFLTPLSAAPSQENPE